MEVCNAFSELNDPIDQLQRFVDESYRARHGDDEAHPIDDDYIEALSATACRPPVALAWASTA